MDNLITTPSILLNKKPEEILKLAVKRMLPGGPLAKKQLSKLKIYKGKSHPHEAQNLTKHEIKTIITRIGDGTKIILTGDIEQIDNIYVNETSNGLAHAIESFKQHPIAGHVTFKKGERSELATLASKVLWLMI